MKVESIIFNVIAVFAAAAAVVYGVWAKEPVGATALVLSAGLTGMIGAFFWFVSRRIDARPEDRKDAEMADGAGELGFFSPHSWWPLLIALSGSVTAVGMALAGDPRIVVLDEATAMADPESEDEIQQALSALVKDRTVLVIAHRPAAVRGADRIVRAFTNVCRHRGAQLCTEDSGEVRRAFQCPYHAWTYDLDGKLIAAPNLTLSGTLDGEADLRGSANRPEGRYALTVARLVTPSCSALWASIGGPATSPMA